VFQKDIQVSINLAGRSPAGGTNGWGGSNATQNLLVIACSGSDVIELKDNEIVLYPNPTLDAFTVETSEDLTGKSFIIHDVSGRVLSSGKLVGNKSMIQVSLLSSGTYYLNFPETNQTLKFIAYSGGNCATHSGDTVPPIPVI
jgi:hypothetical protein